jgi:hypothetical protein
VGTLPFAVKPQPAASPSSQPRMMIPEYAAVVVSAPMGKDNKAIRDS